MSPKIGKKKNVTLMNNKVLLSPKRWNYLEINNLVLESNVLTVDLKSWAIVIFVLNSHIFLSNFITLERKRKLTKTKTRYLAII